MKREIFEVIKMGALRLSLAFLTMLLGITGCGDRDFVHPSSKLQTQAEDIPNALRKLEEEGSLPKLDETATLPGIDRDGDGIRDDVEALIEEEKVSEFQKESLKTFASAMQRIQTAEEMTPDIAVEITDSYSAEHFCSTAFSSNMEEMLQLYDQLEAFTANTPLRAKRYIGYTVAMNGRKISLPSSGRCRDGTQ
jgi:hypothetical protein